MAEAEFTITLIKKSLINRLDQNFRELMKWTDEDLFRRPLSFLFPADAHGRLDRLLELDDERFDGVLFPRVPLRLKTGGYINFDMKMERLGSSRRRLEFFKPGKADKAPVDDAEPTDMYSFFNFVERLMNSPYDGNLDLTMVSVDGLRSDSKTELSDSDRAAALSDVEANLKKHAIGGQVGRLDEASYSLVTAGDFDEKAFEEELKTVARRLNLDPEVLSPRSKNVTIDDREMDPEKLRQALSHSRGVFLKEIDDDQELDSLSGVLDGIEHNRQIIFDALERHKFLASPRIISDNVAAISVAILQQGKINLQRRIRRPDELVIMADHPDLAYEHDIAQLGRLIRLRKHLKDHERLKPDFYEVCRSTIIQDAFLGELEALLAKHGEEPALVGLRVMGLPPVKQGGPHWEALNALAARGHPLWIDRFGDVVVEGAAIDCLRGGFVQMPVDLMRRLAGHFDGKELMIKLIKNWQEMNVRVISADLPTYELKTLAQQLGIAFAAEDTPEALELLDE